MTPVFIDSPTDWGWRLGPNAHLCPLDTTEAAMDALHAAAAAVGMKRSWFQNTSWPHYDLTVGRARLAEKLPNVVKVRRTQDYIRMRKYMQRGTFTEPGTGLEMFVTKWYVISDSGSSYSPIGYATAEQATESALSLHDYNLEPDDISVWMPVNAALGFEDANRANVVRGLDMLIFWTANDSEQLWNKP